MSDNTKEKIDSNTWRFFMPFSEAYLEKAIKIEDKKNDADDPTDWKIGGVASSGKDEDLEGEIVVPTGIDFDSYFKRFGFFNSEHKKGAAFKVGIPTKAEINKDGDFYVEGYLLKDMPEAQGIWTLMKTLKKGNHPRRIGFSIEGKTVLQEGRKILKSFLLEIAVTANPVNTSTYADVLKSLSVCKKDNSLESLNYLAKSSSVADLSDNSMLDKTLEAGAQIEGQTDGGALRTQDLEARLKVLTNKGMTPDEALEYVCLKANITKDMAAKVLKYSDILKKMAGKK